LETGHHPWRSGCLLLDLLCHNQDKVPRSPLFQEPDTTGNPGFAESRKLSAKAKKPSAKALPTVALGIGLTENFFSATALCQAPELEALGTGCAESPQWAVGQKK
jgi:hypothetical protein